MTRVRELALSGIIANIRRGMFVLMRRIINRRMRGLVFEEEEV